MSFITSIAALGISYGVGMILMLSYEIDKSKHKKGTIINRYIIIWIHYIIISMT